MRDTGGETTSLQLNMKTPAGSDTCTNPQFPFEGLIRVNTQQKQKKLLIRKSKHRDHQILELFKGFLSSFFNRLS